MGICQVDGNFKFLVMSLDDGGIGFSAVFDSIEFFDGSSDELPPFPGEVEITCESAEDLATLEKVSGRKPVANSGVWLRSYDFKGEERYHLTLMLLEDRFQVFQRMAEKHIGSDVGFGFGFEYGKLAEGIVQPPAIEGAERMLTECVNIDLSFGSAKIEIEE